MREVMKLINLSNHPYNTWSASQMEASLQYGECVDISFPQIAAHSTEEEIKELVNIYFNKIVSQAEECKVTVHLMGELTFSFQLVQRLNKCGIRCIASCADRNVVQEGELKKVIFDFVRFREFCTVV